jgi:hypothetical protein
MPHNNFEERVSVLWCKRQMQNLKGKINLIETKIDLMHPIHPYLLEEEDKHYSGRCICQDETFKERYREKWIKKMSGDISMQQ